MLVTASAVAHCQKAIPPLPLRASSGNARASQVTPVPRSQGTPSKWAVILTVSGSCRSLPLPVCCYPPTASYSVTASIDSAAACSTDRKTMKGMPMSATVIPRRWTHLLASTLPPIRKMTCVTAAGLHWCESGRFKGCLSRTPVPCLNAQALQCPTYCAALPATLTWHGRLNHSHANCFILCDETENLKKGSRGALDKVVR